jgi:site-specific DNA-cytosine methylase
LLLGGLHDALKCAAPDAHVVAAFDWDPSAIAVYEANHGPGIARKVSLYHYIRGFALNNSHLCQLMGVIDPDTIYQ